MYVYRRWIVDSCNGKIDANFSFAFFNDPRNYLYHWDKNLVNCYLDTVHELNYEFRLNYENQLH